MCVAGLGAYSCTDKYDLDTEQPSGLNSIYGYMVDRPEFSTFMRLVDDCGEKDVMSRTGSNTLFIANNEAFAKFFANNTWGVSSYEDLTQTQKRMLFYSAMIRNPLTTSMLSTSTSSSTPVRGETMRRITGLSLLDTVSVFLPTDQALPTTKQWKSLREAGEPIVLFTDDTNSPMVQFTAKFMSSNHITSDDMDFLYNQPAGTRAADDAHIGNATITTPNQFCLNGFVHEVNQVLTPLDNMAEIVRKNAENSDSKKSTSMFSRILERFSAPDLMTNEQTRLDYNNAHGTDYKQLYVKRYASNRSKGNKPFNGGTVDTDLSFKTVEMLKFDPGWNSYIPAGFNDRDALAEDMAVMLVPTDEAFDYWWNVDPTGGSDIREYYSQFYTQDQLLDSIPLSVFQPLINNCLQENFTLSVPSKFGTMKDEAQVELGIKQEDVDSVIMGCNGAVYLTNKVFTPATYRSVLYPAVVQENMLNIVNTAVSYLNYDAYLNAMMGDDIKYSFFIPVNNFKQVGEEPEQAFLTYLDPVSYGNPTTKLWEFYFDKTSGDAEKNIKARVYDFDITTGEIDESSERKLESAWRGMSNGQPKISYSNPLVDRMQDILDNIIVIGTLRPGKEYYQTKGGNYIRVTGNVNNLDDMQVGGSLQDEAAVGVNPGLAGKFPAISVSKKFEKDNGDAYLVNGIPSTTRLSVADALALRPECSEFYKLLELCAVSVNTANEYAASAKGNLVSVINAKGLGNETNNNPKYLPLLNSFNYTIYAPNDEAMQKAFEWGLPTVEQIDAAQQADDAFNEQLEEEGDNTTPRSLEADKLKSVVLDFIKYHIQDNSVYVDEGFVSQKYESSIIALKPVTKERTDGDGNPVLDNENRPVLDTLSWTSGRPYTIDVDVSSAGITLKDAMGKEAHVVKRNSESNGLPLYNIQAREYWLNKEVITSEWSSYSSALLNTTSNAVVHIIDRPLVYDVPFINGTDDVDKSKHSQFKYMFKKLYEESEAKPRRK